MNKKLISAVLSVIMAVSTIVSGSVSVFAEDEYTENTDSYKGVTAEITDDGKVNLRWPAVDKQGNIVADNEEKTLKALNQDDDMSSADRGVGYYMRNGYITEFENWDFETGTKSNSNTKGDYNLLEGVKTLTDDDVAKYISGEYQLTETQHIIYDDSQTALLYDTAIANSNGYATAYVIQYSSDNGETWKTDKTYNISTHAKKMKRLAYIDNSDGTAYDSNGKVKFQTDENGTTKYVQIGDSFTYNSADAESSDVWYIENAYNTWYFVDQQLSTLDINLESGQEYIVKISAYDHKGSVADTSKDPYNVFYTKFTAPTVETITPAFPTVEGGGIAAQGGRGGDVYVVTNLTDSVSNPQPGSLRYGLERKDLSDGTSPRTIIFAVGGTINVDPTVSKDSRRLTIGSNTTILGQTAPGEGITIAGASAKFDGSNIVARYLRFRLGDGYDQDAGSASGENIVIDHCTFSWSVDETFSAKELLNSSIQYNIIANGLAMVDKNGINNSDGEIESGESEAKHGMGSLLNGFNSTYTHNLYAHNGTRNPRFEGSFSYGSTTYQNRLEFSNNVVYNWGHNSGYGGERGNAEVNFIANYYKPGLNTLEKVKTQFFDCDSSSSGKSSYYFDKNVMYGSDEVTADNSQGFSDLDEAVVLTSPVELLYPYDAEDADTAYQNVLDSVGASYVRDAQDSRLINQVKNGTGSFINSDEEAGGYETAEYAQTITDTDKDGLPDEWETAMGLDPNDSTDSAKVIDDEESPYFGYAYIEVYASGILGEWDNGIYRSSGNPDVEITALSDGENDILDSVNTDLLTNKKYTVSVEGNADKYSLYLNDEIVNENGLDFTPDEVGTYKIAVRAEKDGKSTFSDTIDVTVVNSFDNMEDYTAKTIGDAKAKGNAFYDSSSESIVIEGAGRIGITASSSTQSGDSFFYNFKEVTGDMEMVAMVDNWAKLDYYQQAGVMLRGSLDPKSEFYMSAFTYMKGEDYEGVTDAAGGTVKGQNIRSFARKGDNQTVAAGFYMSVPVKRIDLEPNHGWVKVTRVGQTVTTSASLDGETWYTLNEYETTLPETCYIGFATAAAQDTHELVKYNKAEFSNISLMGDVSKYQALMGDVDEDESVSASDALLTLQYSLNSDSMDIDETVADVDEDGLVTASDALQILQKSLNNDYVFQTVSQ